jgi:VWFA-related protein
MPPHRIILALCIAASLASTRSTDSQTAIPYSLTVAVDEVEITFHPLDARGLPVTDLRLDELRVLDNGRPPRRTVLFEALRDLPIRAGILLDTSASMAQNRPLEQNIASLYTQRILDQKTDQAFVMSFGKRFETRQTWSNNPAALTVAIQHSGTAPSTTAIFDALYAACRYKFGKLGHAASGNFILLFSDGEDDASFLILQDAVTACQQTNTAIYSFGADSQSQSGSHILFQLASLTGGRVFRDSGSAEEIDDDLRLIQANLRNQYRLVYNPAELKRDGAFHTVVLLPPDRVAAIYARTGYYAPTH